MTFVTARASREFPGCIFWMTGLSASGKTTICTAAAEAITNLGLSAVVLDGDVLRQTICRDLGYSREDRHENMRRIAALAYRHASAGEAVLVAAISPYRQLREQFRCDSPVPFFEVFADAPLQVCEARDPKGLYRRARAGAIANFTGIDDIYEPPLAPDAHCHTATETIAESCARVTALLAQWLDGDVPRGVASSAAPPAAHTPA